MWIVTPCHNDGPNVRECIQKSLEQTYPCNIVVVNDCSTDDSATVINEFKEKIHIIHHDKNMGPGAARNSGIAYAIKGGAQFIQFCDADDYMGPTKVEKLLSIIGRDPRIGAVMDDYYHLVDYPNLEPFQVREYKRSPERESMWLQNLVHCNCLVRVEALESTKLDRDVYMDPTMRVAQDYDLWLRILAQYVIWHHPEPLSIVRVGPNNSADPIRGQIREQCMQAIRNRNYVNYVQ